MVKKRGKPVLNNNEQLRLMIDKSGLTQQAALDLFNEGQGRPLALRTFKTYLAQTDSKTRAPCPDSVLERFSMILS